MLTFKSILYAAYILAVAYLVFISGDDSRMQNLFSRPLTVNLFPLRDKIDFFTSGQVWGPNNMKFFLKEFFGNILLFIPLPIILMLGEGFTNTFKVIRIVFFSSLFIEVTQFFTGLGHADIDDLILNTLGGVLGAAFASLVQKREFWLRWQSFLALPPNTRQVQTANEQSQINDSSPLPSCQSHHENFFQSSNTTATASNHH